MARKRKPRPAPPGPPSTLAPASEQNAHPRRRRGSEPSEPVGLVAEWQVWKNLARSARENWAVILVPLALALVLRLFRLGNSDLWIDEILVYYDALNGTFESVSRSHRVHLGAVGWILNHVSDSPVGLRLWGAMLGSLAAPAMALAGLWLAGRRNGLIWGLLGALSPYLIFYSQDANYYGPMSFFAAAQMMFYISFFRGAPVGGVLGILALGLTAHFNHPFGSVLTAVALGGCFLGSLVYGELRREIYSVNPKNWLTRPGLVVLILGGLLLGPKAGGAFASSYKKLTSIFEIGSGLRRVEFRFGFFVDAYTSFGVSHFHAGDIGRVLAVLVFAMCVAGIVWLIVKCRDSIPYLPLAGLLIVVPVVSYFIVFNIDAPILFRLRYFTFHVPLYLGAVGFFCFAAGERLARRGAPLAYSALAIVCLIWVPYLGKWYVTDRGNFRNLTEYLAEHRTPDDEIFIPMYHDVAQAKYYFPKSSPSIDMADTTQTYAVVQAGELARSNLLSMLYGKEQAWVISAWREAPIDPLWDFLEDAIPAAYRGNSATDAFGDARLYQWNYGSRVLLPTAASEFEWQEDGTSWLAAGPGKWQIQVADSSSSARSLGLDVEGPGITTSRDSSGNLIVESDRVSQLIVTATGALGARIRAIPVFTERVRIPATDSINYVEDARVREVLLEDGPVAIERPFDGMHSYMLWVDPAEERQLVLLPVQRTKAFEEAAKSDPSRNPNGDLWLAVACDGEHLGMWRLPVGEIEEVTRVVTGIELPSGNHRIDISGFTPRLGYVPFNTWKWAGLEWNAGPKEEVLASVEDGGLSFTKFPRAVFDWGEAGATDLPEGYSEASVGYSRGTSDRVVGPSGHPALEFDLAGPAKNKGAYHTVFAPPFPVKPGQFMAFSSSIRLDGTTTHDAMLVTLFFDSQGQLVHRQFGSQQKLTGRFSFDWKRFVEVVPVPREAALAAPGVMVFPPDLEKLEMVGTASFDAIRSIQDAGPLENIPGLSHNFFFPIGESGSHSAP